MSFKFISKIGLEVEGGWNRNNWHGETVHVDGTVQVAGYENKEIVSRPLASLEAAKEWLRRIYPQATNNTCGFHVHFSIKNDSDYARLMDKTFWTYFQNEIKKWAVENQIRNSNFWNRLRGENSWCLAQFEPDAQAAATCKSPFRYKQLNFCKGFHGTVECRLMPTFKNVEVAVKAMEALANIIETYLESAPIQVGFKKTITE